MKHPTITVLVGIPGSGKSSYIKEHLTVDDNTFIYSTDNFIEIYAKRQNKTYSEVFDTFIKPATAYMNEMLISSVNDNLDIIWDQTNMSPKKRKSILSKIPLNYYKICVCRIPPRNDVEWAEIDRRIASRPGKYIPKHVLESMAKSYQEPLMTEGFDDIYLYDIYGVHIYASHIIH